MRRRSSRKLRGRDGPDAALLGSLSLKITLQPPALPGVCSASDSTIEVEPPAEPGADDFCVDTTIGDGNSRRSASRQSRPLCSCHKKACFSQDKYATNRHTCSPASPSKKPSRHA